MNEYNYKVQQYEKTIADINAKTSIIQEEDRTLELRLKQLDTEQNALATEMEAVKKIIKENVEKTLELFKDFKRAFKVKEMKKPIDALEEYLFPRKAFSFPIYIEESGESFVEYAVTEKELTKIKKVRRCSKNSIFALFVNISLLFASFFLCRADDNLLSAFSSRRSCRLREPQQR